MDVNIRFLSYWELSVFSQTVEHALRAVVHLADHSPSPRTTEQIAAATMVPKLYLSKVIQGLLEQVAFRSNGWPKAVLTGWIYAVVQARP